MRRLIGVLLLMLVATVAVAQDPSPNVVLADGLVVAREIPIGRIHIATDVAAADAAYQQLVHQYGLFGAQLADATWVRTNAEDRLAALLDALEQHDPDFYQSAAAAFQIQKDPPAVR